MAGSPAEFTARFLRGSATRSVQLSSLRTIEGACFRLLPSSRATRKLNLGGACLAPGRLAPAEADPCCAQQRPRLDARVGPRAYAPHAVGDALGSRGARARRWRCGRGCTCRNVGGGAGVTGGQGQFQLVKASRSRAQCPDGRRSGPPPFRPARIAASVGPTRMWIRRSLRACRSCRAGGQTGRRGGCRPEEH